MRSLRIILLTLLALLTISVNAASFSISEKQINHYLATKLKDKVPLQDSVGLPGLFTLDYHLYDISTLIGQTEEKRVEIQGVVDGIIKIRHKQYDAKIKLNIDTIPYYDPEQAALYLKESRLVHWEITPIKYQKEVQHFIPLLADGINQLLNKTPVYKLDASNAKEALIKKFGQRIVVEKGELRLEAALF